MATRAMVLMVERNHGEHLIRRFVGRGNESDPRDVKIASLKQRIQELEFPQLQQNSPTKEAETESNVWDDRSEDVNPFGGGNPGFYDDHYDNPLLTKETESEPIIWDIGDEEEEYHFVNKYLNFQEDPIMSVEEESCPDYDTDNEEEESMPVYDTDIEEVIEEEDGDEKEVVYDDYEEASVKERLRNSEDDVRKRIAPMDNKLGFKTIKVRGRVLIKKENLMQGIQIWMLRVQGTSEANSRTSFFQVGEDDAD
nr:hypothetical protein [Tanacetum cinerariifolium]